MEYASKDIRNILVAGHAGCGKTTLVEALLYQSGATERMGRVEDGTTASDFDPEEVKRKASLNSTSGTPFLGGIAAFVDGASKVTDSKYYGSLVSGVAALVSGGVAAQTESGAAISGCGFGGTIEGAAMTEADVCGDANGTFTDNYIWDGQE